MDIARVARARYTTKAFDPARTIPEPLMDQLRTVLHSSPSSINSQPWHFFVATTSEAKARIVKAMGKPPFNANEPKVRDASHVMVMCARMKMDDSYLGTVLDRENIDGRFATPEAMAGQDKSKRFYRNLHRDDLKDESAWLEHQVFIALGALLLAAGALEIDACPMEGFDPAILDRELGLTERGLKACVLVALGYRGADDFNAKLPKSRLPAEAIFTDL